MKKGLIAIISIMLLSACNGTGTQSESTNTTTDPVVVAVDSSTKVEAAAPDTATVVTDSNNESVIK